MVNVLILFGIPRDAAAFDNYFTTSYLPLLHTVPNLEGLVVNRVAGAAKGDTPFYLIAEMRFGSEEAMQEGLNSEAGLSMAKEMSQFASGGVTVLFSQATVETLAAGTNQ